MIIAMRKKITKSILNDVPDEHAFWCCDGVIIKNLEGLHIALKHMSQKTFHYHVNHSKNDFSKWVKEVVGDDTLAHQLDKTATRASMEAKILKRIDWLKRG
jgi:CRISPR/Cas system CMR-associated protein Cmr5 small subunit